MSTAKQKQETIVYIRWMIGEDLSKVLLIETESFEFPWTKNDFVCCLRQRNCIGMVVEHENEVEDKVVGFMIYEVYKPGIEILNFAVHPDWRRQRIGTQMIRKLIGKLSAKSRKEIVLAVRETNLSAQLFFKECGFKAFTTLRKYYDDVREHYGNISEDAYLMRYQYKAPQE